MWWCMLRAGEQWVVGVDLGYALGYGCVIDFVGIFCLGKVGLREPG
jgi:hypothetical protein